MNTDARHTAEARAAAAADFDRPLLLTPGEDLAGWALRKLGGALLAGVALTCVLAVLFIFVFIVRQAMPLLASGHRWELLTSLKWYPTAEPPVFGAQAMIAGSAYVMVGALIVAVPIGVLAAAFLSDIVPFGARQVIKPIIELLAAIPSVAYGFFALLVLAPWMQRTWGLSTGTNALNASIILAVMAVPTIVSISEDALSAVGRDLREGAYALGSTRAETLVKVVIPAAGGGILAAVILGMMRAVGETMVVWMASGNANKIPGPWWDLSQPVRTLTATIAGEMGEAPDGSIHRHALFALGLVLLAITFGMNVAGEALLARARRRGRGGKPK